MQELKCDLSIVASGIKTVIYCESYPDVDSGNFFEKLNKKGYHIDVHKFEGVKARAYMRLFSLWRGQMEETIKNKRGA